MKKRGFVDNIVKLNLDSNDISLEIKLKDYISNKNFDGNYFDYVDILQNVAEIVDSEIYDKNKAEYIKIKSSEDVFMKYLDTCVKRDETNYVRLNQAFENFNEFLRLLKCTSYSFFNLQAYSVNKYENNTIH